MFVSHLFSIFFFHLFLNKKFSLSYVKLYMFMLEGSCESHVYFVNSCHRHGWAYKVPVCMYVYYFNMTVMWWTLMRVFEKYSRQQIFWQCTRGFSRQGTYFFFMYKHVNKLWSHFILLFTIIEFTDLFLLLFATSSSAQPC